MSFSLTKELDMAINAAVAATRICQSVQELMVHPEAITKADRSPVTVADFASQAVACRILKDGLPEDPILAEETSEALRQPENEGVLGRVTQFVRGPFPEATGDAVRRWVDLGTREIADRFWCLDPIDGTKGFLRGDQYAIALALVLEGKARLGVLACPNLPHNLARPHGPRGVVFLALAGEGAYQMGLGGGNAVPVRVSPARLGGDLRLCESFESGHSDHEGQSQVASELGIKAPPIRMDSQAKYGVVARGDASLYLRIPNPRTPDYREKAWDHAAGAVIVEEAGGRVTDVHGKRLHFGVGYALTENTGVVATNGVIHDWVLDALRSSTGN